MNTGIKLDHSLAERLLTDIRGNSAGTWEFKRARHPASSAPPPDRVVDIEVQEAEHVRPAAPQLAAYHVLTPTQSGRIIDAYILPGRSAGDTARRAWLRAQCDAERESYEAQVDFYA